MTATALPTPRRAPWRRVTLSGGWLTFPAWAYLLLFFALPLALVVFYSFGYKPDLFTTYATDRLGFGRYAEALGPQYRSTFLTTLQIAALGTVLALLIGLPLAYWLAIKCSPRRRGFYLALLMVPFFTNFLIRTVGWQITLAPSGWVSALMKAAGGGELELLYTRAAVQIGVVYNYLPLMILPLFVAVDRAGPTLREAGRDLGASRLTTFLRVTVPLAAPGITSGCMLVFIPLMGDYVTPEVLGGARGAMAGQTIASQFQTAQNWALGAAMTVVLMVFALVCVAVVGVLVRVAAGLVDRHLLGVTLPGAHGAEAGHPVPLPRPAPAPARWRLDGWSGALRVWAVLVYAFLYLPIVVVVVYSFNTGRVLSAFDGFGFSSYTDALTNDAITSSVLTSLQIGLLSALLATVLGSLAGIALGGVAVRRWWALGLIALLTVTLVTPDIANAVAFLPWFVTLGVDWNVVPLNNGLVRLVIAHAAVSMVAVAFIVRARIGGMDTRLTEAAADLYAGPAARLRRVTLPIAAPGIAAGFLLAFTFSLDDVVISSFVQQPGYTPWPVYIFSTVRVALRPEVAAMATLMLVFTLALLAAAAVILKRTGVDSKGIVEMLGT